MKSLPVREVPGPKSAQLLQVAQTCEPAASLDQVPVVWDHAQGVWVTDVDGNRYLDLTSGVLVTNLGHSHPGLVAAIQNQAARVTNCYSFSTPERIQAAQKLLQNLPSSMDRVFFLSTGAEAVEVALRLVRRFTRKQEILAFYGAFHGRTYGAMGVAGTQGARRGFGSPVPGGILAPYGYCYRCFYDKAYPDCDFYCLKMLDRLLESSSGGDLGAVIVEPYQGAAGFIFPPDGWLLTLQTWARERGLLFILDEVQSSFGRTGKYFALEWDGLQPDMLCLGKGLGSGMPCSAVVTRREIFDCMKPGELSSTWGGNPLASAAALAVMDALEQENLVQNSLQVGAWMLNQLLEMKTRFACLGDVRGKGLVIGLEIVEPKDGYTPAPNLARHLIQKAAENGLLMGKVGLYGNVLRVAPPLVITLEEAEVAVSTLSQVLQEACAV